MRPTLIKYHTLRQCSFELLDCFLADLGVVEVQPFELRELGQRRYVTHLRVAEVQVFELRQLDQRRHITDPGVVGGAF